MAEAASASPAHVVIVVEKPDPKWGEFDRFSYNCRFEADGDQKGTVWLGDTVTLKTRTLKIGFQRGDGQWHWIREGAVISGTFRYHMKPFSEVRQIWGPAMPCLDFEAGEAKSEQKSAEVEKDVAKSVGDVTEEQVRLVEKTISEVMELEKTTNCAQSVKRFFAREQTKVLVARGFLAENQRQTIVARLRYDEANDPSEDE